MIQFQSVSKTYRRRRSSVTALDSVDLEIRAGEMFGVVGESGSGKSTLLRLVNHLEAPTSGTVLVDGVDLDALPERERRRHRQDIGMVFQHFNLLANSTVEANVRLPLQLQRGGVAQRERALEMLDFVGMAGHRGSYPVRLSGGEKQRVAIARALVSGPSVLLCDEPTSALDAHHTEEVMETLRAVRDRMDTTVLLVSHELGVIRSSCDRAAVLEDGHLRTVVDVNRPEQTRRKGTYAERARAVLEGRE
jgi:D-methionine transport system ATP-binding protein